MKLNYKLYLLFIGFLFNFHSASAQNISNEGADFWLCFPDHIPADDKVAAMSVFITSKNNSSGVVSCGNYTETFAVSANTVKEILVPRDISFIGRGSKIAPSKGIRVKVDEGKSKVVVYAHVFAGFRSAATLVLPYEALGRKYFAMAYDQQTGLDKNFRSQFNIVAVDANTTINIKPVVNGIPQAGFSQTLTNVGDVYQYQNVQDITGTLIEVDSVLSGCKRIAVFSGSSGIAISTPTCDVVALSHTTSDPLLQQLYPIESWGKTFPLVPFYNRNAGSIYRVIASEDNTTVTVDGVKVVLNTGKFYTSPPITNVSLIQADKPISVAQFAISQFCSDSRNEFADEIVGDPDMVILNPLEYSIDKITLYSSSRLDITEQYLNIVIPTTKVSTFTLNNVKFTNSFYPVPSAKDYSYAQLNLTGLGANFSLAADTGFNAMAYGFGQLESYAYSAGTSLASTTVVNAVKYGTNDVVRVACVNQPYDFKLYLPYKPTKLVWQLGVNTAFITQNAPAPEEQTVVNNKLLYQFKLPANKVFTTSGTKNITVVSAIPVGANVCSTVDEEKIDYIFEVSDLPVAEFTAPAKSCITKPAKFTYVDKNIGEPVTAWVWDFGDGTYSNEQSPSHVYTALGTYQVKLNLMSKAGCNSLEFEKSIEIIKPLTNKFEIVSPLCTNTNISFIDQTVSADGIMEWLWDFGDGKVSTEQNPAHIYSKSGTYQVRLTTASQTGCTEILEKTIKVVDPAEIDFADPGSCIDDLVAFNAVLKSGTVISWFWDFGDGSIDDVERVKQNPQHKYLSTGTYNVNLKATSPQGCVTSLTKTITISGSNPNVIFEVLDKNNLCSNTPVSFKNTSTIFFGKIVRLDISYENKTSGTSIVYTDDEPAFGKIYTYKYPKSATDQNYQVVFRAYSGQACYQESAPITITVNGSPEVSFDNVEPVCLNSAKFLLSVAKETTGIKGTFKLEGKGVLGNYFDPAAAGVGDHLITYTFTATKGCQEVITNTIKVVDIPKVDAGKDLDILLAGEKRIETKVTGNNVTYKWTPTTGLSDDSILNPIASPTESTKYTLLVTSKDGCMVADEVFVTVHIDPMIPNVFSPNADGINDTWSIKYLETFVKANIRIFNRGGQQVFFSNQYTTPWDGRYNNADVPVGVYYYIIEPNNGRKKYTGSITLLR
ncbi:T9SS C-terminal target domain-containing protein [Pedobacter arcticus]|uniref:T9SS C-terminal target domain-containing protein n=1 Tax=Pedobacter arcticus TaxID=752140 RepID=UPI0002FFBE6B|nr:T9SS C-terminal target domain-containing protein [Pedobacter arcticus]